MIDLSNLKPLPQDNEIISLMSKLNKLTNKNMLLTSGQLDNTKFRTLVRVREGVEAVDSLQAVSIIAPGFLTGSLHMKDLEALNANDDVISFQLAEKLALID